MPKLFESILLCGYCGVRPALVSGAEIYGPGAPKDYVSKKFWQCKKCDAYVGCHKDTDIPLGTLANWELRNLRVMVHDRLDEYWHSKRISRTGLYKLLAKEFGHEVHVGAATKEECIRLLQFDIEKYL